MHFFSIVTTLAFASTAVLSAPINQANQTSAVSAITTILANLQSAIAADVASLGKMKALICQEKRVLSAR